MLTFFFCLIWIDISTRHDYPFLGVCTRLWLQRRVQEDHGSPPEELLEEKMQERCQASKYKIFERKLSIEAPGIVFPCILWLKIQNSDGQEKNILDFFSLISKAHLLKDSILPNGSNHNFSHFLGQIPVTQVLMQAILWLRLSSLLAPGRRKYLGLW